MSKSIRRKEAIGTLLEAGQWLRRNPVLLLASALYGLLDALADIPGFLGFLFAVAALLALVAVDGLCHAIGSQEARGTDSDLGRAATAVLYRYPSLFALTIVYGVAVAVGLVLLVLPGLYLGVRLSLALPACVIDDRGVIESLETSWDAAAGSLVKLFGITLLGSLFVAGGTLVTVLVPDLDTGVAIAVTAVLAAFVSPVVQLAYARVYLENRPSSGPDAGGSDERAKSEWIAT